MTHGRRVKLDDLCMREYKLAVFYDQVRIDREGQPGSLDGLPEYKNELSQLVGWYSTTTDTVLQEPEAWNVAYNRLIEIMEGG